VSELRWQVGDASIVRIAETDASAALVGLIDGLDPAAVAAAGWLRPHFVEPSGRLKGVVQAFVIRIGTTTIVVDPGVGNGKSRAIVTAWDDLHTRFVDRLRAAGVDPAEVDFVINTHLHFDHVGGNTRWSDGGWEPTYRRARYVMSAAEFSYWQGKPAAEIADQHAGFADSVVPVVEAGQADLVPDDQVVVDGVRLIPAPGHTPHHLTVLVESAGRSALFMGDVMHHPCQIAHPAWGAVSDFDPDRARKSRRQVVARYADTDTLVLGAHFADPVAGHIRSDGAENYLAVVSSE
jgi:glyoxylase-like metal-dependent hydrolase (beta-lactamase superfamily II)